VAGGVDFHCDGDRVIAIEAVNADGPYFVGVKRIECTVVECHHDLIVGHAGPVGLKRHINNVVDGSAYNGEAPVDQLRGRGLLFTVRGDFVGTGPPILDVQRTILRGSGLAHRELGDQRAANQAAERALALAEPDRPVLPFLMTGSRELLEALPRHETAHAALLTDILDVMHGASPAATDQYPYPTELSPGELRVLRFLPTNLSRLEIASELSVSPNTVSTHIRSIYAKLGVRDRSSAVQRARELRLLAVGRTR